MNPLSTEIDGSVGRFNAAKLDFARVAADAAPLSDLDRTLAAEPNNSQARYAAAFQEANERGMKLRVVTTDDTSVARAKPASSIACGAASMPSPKKSRPATEARHRSPPPPRRGSLECA